MKKLMIILLIMLMTLNFASCGKEIDAPSTSNDSNGNSNNVSLEEGVMTLSASHSLSPTHPYHLGLEKYKEIVEEKTDGKVIIDIFHSAQLGNERDNIEGLQMGTLDIAVSSTGPIGTFENTFSMLDLPYLFDDYDDVDRILDGEIGDELLAKLDNIGIKGAAFWENGFRELTNSKTSVDNVEDLKGLKIRTMQNEVQINAFEAMGADPTPMAYSEVFTALQQKVIDGQENPIPVIYNDRLYEVQDYLTITNHVYSPAMLLISNKTLEQCTPEIQKILIDTAREVAPYQKQLIREQETEQIKALEEAGMTVDIPELSSFKEACQDVYKKYENQFDSDLLNRILDK